MVNLNEREKLIQKLKLLLEKHKIKQEKCPECNGELCGSLTKEAISIMRLYPQMQQLRVTFDDFI